jgi:polyphosphate kinase
MTAPDTTSDKALRECIDADLRDSFDEEVELEFGESRLEQFRDTQSTHGAHETLDRSVYFKELFRLQGELVKLQDWVQHNKLKVVVIFEGRDSAGKGGVIKRITQRLNPRVCRVAALPAPNERERTQWYFQRYATHLPAGGEIVLFDRSWYNRAGVERVMGFLHRGAMRGVLSLGAGVRTYAGAFGHHPDQVLVFDHRRRAAAGS